MTTKNNEEIRKKRLQLPVWLVITVAITLVLGLVGGLVISKLLSQRQISFSVVSLISFVFTIALGAAAVILATITIVLSRHAEDALIRRSDEGIKLQNEVFVRTSEVLSKIQASTGVTEKRLEDIISGRTAPIVQEAVAKSKLAEAGLDKQAIDKISKDLAESLKSEIAPLIRSGPAKAEEKLSEIEITQKKRGEISARWNEFRLQVVSEVRKIGGVELISEVEGKYSAEISEKFWDLLIKANGKRFAFDIHTKDQVFKQQGGFYGLAFKQSHRYKMIRSISWQALQDNIDKVFVVFDKDVWSDKGITELAKLIDSFNSNSKGPEIVPLSGSPEEIAKKIMPVVTGKKSA